MLCYGSRELDHFKAPVLEAQASTLLSLCLRNFGAKNINNVFEEVIVFNDSVVFRESEEYYIVASFENSKTALDRQFDFDPFDEEQWDFSAVHGNLTVYRKSDNTVALGKNFIRWNKRSFNNETHCVDGAAEFIGSLICLTLNCQQEWFRLLGENVFPAFYEKVLNLQDIGSRYSDETCRQVAVENYVQGLFISSGHNLSRSLMQLDQCIEKSASPKFGWDVYNYTLRKGVITVYRLGDARILDFEYKLLK